MKNFFLITFILLSNFSYANTFECKDRNDFFKKVILNLSTGYFRLDFIHTYYGFNGSQDISNESIRGYLDANNKWRKGETYRGSPIEEVKFIELRSQDRHYEVTYISRDYFKATKIKKHIICK